ncbi:MAG: thiol peroxidase [Candidatus Eisenbacteria bacterium]|nr:thiol peroxidase [Candidatus Eisenbacteria bacterium]
MTERKGVVTADGNPVTLLGDELKVGDKAPDFEAIGNDMQPVKLSDMSGKVVIVAAVPSLDTPVCDMEVRRFNSEAASLGDEIAILTVSMDLPFAQKRWCGAAGVEEVVTASDHRSGEFGEKYGVLIKELRLLARSLFVIDREGVIRYIQIVDDITREPDYDAVLSAAKELA